MTDQTTVPERFDDELHEHNDVYEATQDVHDALYRLDKALDGFKFEDEADVHVSVANDRISKVIELAMAKTALDVIEVERDT